MSDFRQSMDVDIVCVGFGPAMGGFLTTLARHADPDLQVICYERADDTGFGVSGAVTRARGIRATFPDLNPEEIPMAAPVRHEKVTYLLDPIGASRRSRTLRVADRLLRTLRLPKDHAWELPWTPPFLRKDGGLLLSIGQFMQWTGAQAMSGGTVQIWPGMPVSEALVEGERVVGVRLLDQGTDRAGHPEAGYLPGMDIHAALTVVADGPVGAVGRQLDGLFGLPDGHHQHEWVSSSLGRTQVSIGGVLAPLIYASTNQINVLVPYEASGQVNMTITSAAGSSETLPLLVVQTQPNIFVVLNSDGSVNSTLNPAAVGETVSILVSGAGASMPTSPDGTIAGSPAPAPALKVQANFYFTIFEGFGAGVGTDTVTPTYAGSIPGMVIDMLWVDAQAPNLNIMGPPPFGVAVVVGDSTLPEFPFYAASPPD